MRDTQTSLEDLLEAVIDGGALSWSISWQSLLSLCLLSFFPVSVCSSCLLLLCLCFLCMGVANSLLQEVPGETHPTNQPLYWVLILVHSCSVFTCVNSLCSDPDLCISLPKLLLPFCLPACLSTAPACLNSSSHHCLPVDAPVSPHLSRKPSALERDDQQDADRCLKNSFVICTAITVKKLAMTFMFSGPLQQCSQKKKEWKSQLNRKKGKRE